MLWRARAPGCNIEPMSTHVYRRETLTGDAWRSVLGTAVTATGLVMVPPGFVVTPILALLVALFAGFGVRTAFRARTVIDIDDQGCTVVAFNRTSPRRSFAWSELERVRLTFFATRRRRGEGIMELTLWGGGKKAKFDSQLEGFGKIAAAVHDAAHRQGVGLS
ncbi:MAG: hypothetical protein O7A03_03960, partial [Alphaproteobacteria bacterium]|nr:hypothetical protein [Alphaproteobacteria bacterium]